MFVRERERKRERGNEGGGHLFTHFVSKKTIYDPSSGLSFDFSFNRAQVWHLNGLQTEVRKINLLVSFFSPSLLLSLSLSYFLCLSLFLRCFIKLYLFFILSICFSSIFFPFFLLPFWLVLLWSRLYRLVVFLKLQMNFIIFLCGKVFLTFIVLLPSRHSIDHSCCCLLSFFKSSLSLPLLSSSFYVLDL